jgi:hypothetical protein
MLSKEGIEKMPGITYSRVCIVEVDSQGESDWSNEIDIRHWTLVKEEGWLNCGPTVALFRDGLFYYREPITTDCFNTELYRGLVRQVCTSERRKEEKRTYRQTVAECCSWLG